MLIKSKRIWQTKLLRPQQRMVIIGNTYSYMS